MSGRVLGGMIICLGEMQICIWSRWCHCHSLLRWVLPFWYQLTRKSQLKGH